MYADAHIHLDGIRYTALNETGKCTSKISHYAKGVPAPSLDKLVEHIKKNSLDEVSLIYESLPEPVSSVYSTLKEGLKEVRALYFYWVRDPYLVRNSDELILPYDITLPTILDTTATALSCLGYLDGLKVHPQLDQFSLDSSCIVPAIRVARKYNIPITFHCDDRVDYMENTSPKRIINVASKFPDIKWIIGHGGAYASTRCYGQYPCHQPYWDKKRKPYTIEYLLKSSLEIATEYKNVYYDCTTVLNRIKAKIVAKYINKHPEIAPKVFLGSDFPLRGSIIKQIAVLKAAGLKEELLNTIVENRMYNLINQKKEE